VSLHGYEEIENWDWRNPDYDSVFDVRIKRLEYLRAHPEVVPRVFEYYSSRPAEFVHSWGMTFDPRLAERGMRTVIPFVLFPKQREFLDWLLERWKRREDGVVEKSRDMGASWLTVGFAAWMMIFIDGSVVGFGSRKEEYVDKIGDPKSLFWKLREFINLLPQEFQPKEWDEKTCAPFMKVKNPGNSSFVTGEAGDNIGRGNRTSIYFVDEAAFLERPDAADAALSQTSNCRIHVSTPNGVGNPFYRRAHDGKTPKFVFDWRDDPRKDESWYEDQKGKLDPVVVAQEIDRSYSASVANAWIPGDVVKAATRRGPMDVMPFGPIMVGVDVARFGDDKSVITIRRGRVLMQQIVFGKVDTVDCAGRVKDAVLALREGVAQIAVDTIGIGAGVADMLRREFKDIVVDVNSSLRMDDGQNYNLRARIWREMREWLKLGASIPNDNELEGDLTALQYSYRGGLLLIESKEDAKKRGIKSPDRADSLALTFAYPPAERDTLWDAPVTQSSENPAWAAIDERTGY
jgi:phage terminase large subunit